MRLTSTASSEETAIPRRHTCDGEDLSSPLARRGAPPETRSYVLLRDDPDAPAGTWHHWAAYNIPADQTALEPDAARHAGLDGFEQAINDFQRVGYGRPCPPRRHGPHRYHFRLLALSTDRLPVRKDQSCRDVEREARRHLLAEAVLVDVYER